MKSSRFSLIAGLSFFGSFGSLGISMGIAASSAFAAPHGMLRPSTYVNNRTFDIEAVLSTARSDFSTEDKSLLYYGGPVISNPEVYVVFWGSGVTMTNADQIGGFYSTVLNSTYFDWVKEYATNIKAVDGRQGTNQTIGRGTYKGALTITPKRTATTLEDSDIQAELDEQIAAHALPDPTANTIYMIYYPPGITITIDGQSSCQAFCAYHEGFVSPKSKASVFYGVMPDLGGACALGCGFGENEFDSLTGVSSHELMEAVTDPFPTAGSSPSFPQAWNTSDGNEIGDLCTAFSAKLTGGRQEYSIQGEFDNATHGCVSGPYQSP